MSSKTPDFQLVHSSKFMSIRSVLEANKVAHLLDNASRRFSAGEDIAIVSTDESNDRAESIAVRMFDLSDESEEVSLARDAARVSIGDEKVSQLFQSAHIEVFEGTSNEGIVNWSGRNDLSSVESNRRFRAVVFSGQ